MKIQPKWTNVTEEAGLEMHRANIFEEDYSLWVTLNEKGRYEVNVNNADLLCVADGTITYVRLGEAKLSAQLLFAEYIGKHIRVFGGITVPKFVSLTESSAGLAGLTETGTVYLYCQEYKMWKAT